MLIFLFIGHSNYNGIICNLISTSSFSYNAAYSMAMILAKLATLAK